MRLIILFLFVFSSYSVFAFQVRPMVSDIQPMGSKSQETIQVSNTSKNPLTIDVAAYDLLIDKSGQEKLKENDNDFLIIPLTSVIAPGKSQSIIVRYIGEPLLSSSKAYRIAINQVHVDLGKAQGSGIGLAMSFRTLLNVVPDKAEAKLVIKNKEQFKKGIWSVSLENKGNKYIRLSKAKWTIKSKGKTLLLEGNDLSRALTGKLLLPNSTRTVYIKIPSEFNASDSKLAVAI